MPYPKTPEGRARQRSRQKVYCADHREERLIQRRAWYASNKDSARLYNSRRKAKYPDYWRLYKHGVSQDAYAAMLAGQGNRCAACGTTEWGERGPHIDHDHETGTVRGILCLKCNLAAGLLGDSPTRARELAEYLERTKLLKEMENAT